MRQEVRKYAEPTLRDALARCVEHDGHVAKAANFDAWCPLGGGTPVVGDDGVLSGWAIRSLSSYRCTEALDLRTATAIGNCS